MLKLVTAIAILGATAPAFAQQDPELEREEATQIDRTEAADEADAVELYREPTFKSRIKARMRAGAGAVSGDTINPGAGAISIVDGTLDAAVRRRSLQLSLPLDYSHRQTFGTSLTDMRGRGGVRVAYRFAREVQAAAELGLGATWKPDWLDPFQPMEDGSLGTTDRYSHWDRRAAAEIVLRPSRSGPEAGPLGSMTRGRGHQIRVAYDYTLSVYRHDPMFDAIYDPLHLAPWDRDVHRVDAEWRMREGVLRLRAGAQAARWQYFFMFAGDAKTGVTHAGTGGEPPNPLLELRVLKPRVAADYELTDELRVGARYELELMQDTFAGYLSYVGHHPEVVARWLLPRDVQIDASVEAYLRRYGPNSYAYEMDPDPPPLAWGDRRAERLGYITLDGRMQLAEHWSAIAEGKLAVRSTNYAYSIDWNYRNYLAWAGAEYRY